MSDLRVAVYPADDGGCGFYRCIAPARAVNEPGVTVLLDDAPQIQGRWSKSWAGKTEPPADSTLISVEPPDVDVVVFQRPLTRWKADMIPMLRASGVAVVVELDDDFTCIDPRNPAYLPAERFWWPAQQAAEHLLRVHGKVSRPTRTAVVAGVDWWLIPGIEHPSCKDNIVRACKAADLVVCSTDAIARRYGKHGRVRVIPNYIPAAYLNISRPVNDRVRVGWSGSVATHPGDLDVARNIGQVLRGENLPMSIVGTGVGVGPILGCDVDASGWVPIVDYPQQLAGLDVGVCPLRDTAFNRAKSWLKPLEMSALGVAWVASPLPEYTALHRLGAGDLAGSSSQWRSKIGRLVRSESARAEQVEQNRRVAASLTYEGNAWRWATAWVDAAVNRAGSVAA